MNLKADPGRSRKPLFNKQCRVCGDKATCFNFNGLSCETCKIFFRRNAANGDKLKCRREGNCTIDYFTRKCCPKCRLDKCFAIGMRWKTKKKSSSNDKQPPDDGNSPELDDNECHTIHNSYMYEDKCNYIKKQNKRQLPETNTNSDSDCCTGTSACCTENDSMNSLHSDYNSSCVQLSGISDSESNTSIDRLPVLPPSQFELNDYELELIGEIRRATKVFIDEDSLQLTIGAEGIDNNLIFALNLPGVYMGRIVHYSKQLKGFKPLRHEDQLSILKPFYFEILSVRFAYFFNSQLDAFPVIENEFATNAVLMKLDLLRASKQSNAVEITRNLFQSLKIEMENDPTIRDLLITQFLFKPREGLACNELIRYHYCVYRHLLVKYLEHKYRNTSQASKKYSALMSLVNDHWIVKEIIRDLLLDIGAHHVTHILTEIYNLN